MRHDQKEVWVNYLKASGRVAFFSERSAKRKLDAAKDRDAVVSELGHVQIVVAHTHATVKRKQIELGLNYF
jgi:hypothetical protein